MSFGVTCWIDEKRVIAMGLNLDEADVAREIAIEVLESLLHRKVLGEDHGMGGRITRIIVKESTAESSPAEPVPATPKKRSRPKR